MKAYLFACSKQPRVQALSTHPQGDNLPADECAGGIWRPIGNIDLSSPSGAPGVHIEIDVAAAMEHLNGRGWHIVTGGPTAPINAQSDI